MRKPFCRLLAQAARRLSRVITSSFKRALIGHIPSLLYSGEMIAFLEEPLLPLSMPRQWDAQATGHLEGGTNRGCQPEANIYLLVLLESLSLLVKGVTNRNAFTFYKRH